MQLNHYNTHFSNRTFPVFLVCDNVSNAPNVGSLFRVADNFGIQKLILCGKNIPLGRKMAITSRATDKSVLFEVKENALEIIQELKNKGFQIISLEITSTSTPIHSIKFSSKTPIALVVGDENLGISEDILQLSNHIIHIDMYGQNSSMNVVQATNIALYEITRQFL